MLPAVTLVIIFLFLFYFSWKAVHNPHSQIFGQITWQGKNQDRIVALTFDDGPNPAATEKILDILKREAVLATFFVVGKNIEEYPEIIKKINRQGHEIEIHSYSHSHFLFLMPPGFIRHDLEETKKLIIKYTGQKPKIFRPPWGNKTSWLIKTAKALNLRTVTWSLDTQDAWFAPNPEKILKRVKDQIHPGAIILLHDGHQLKTNSRTVTIEALPEIIKFLKNEGFSLVKVSQLI